jgi:glycosyltransferase involved in cell wall biosynthesis
VTVRLSRYRFHNLTYIPFLITYADKLLASDPRAALVRQNLLDGMDGPLLLAVSRLEREKNIPLMLTALAKTARIYPGIVLAIAGSGSLADSLKLEAEHIVPGRVRWLGWIKNTDMPAFYQAADLVLLSSNRESAARVLYESLLSGTPVLTTDTAGAREVIEDRVTGRVVPVGDTEAYAQALIELCGDPSLLEKMGRVGREHMASRVTADAVAKQLRILYEKALGRVK